MSEPKMEVAIIEKDVLNVGNKARELKVLDQASYEIADSLIKAIKTTMKNVDEAFDSGIESAYKHHKELVANKKKYYSPLEEAEKMLKDKSKTWLIEQQRIHEEEQRKAEEIARKAEENRKAELEEQAKRAEAKGDTAKAEERRAMAETVIVQPKIVTPTVVQAQGTSLKDNWTAQVIDQSKIPVSYLLVTDAQKKALQSHLDSLAKASKGTLVIPGVRFVNNKSLAVRL